LIVVRDLSNLRALGLSFQAVQRYETGANRVSASRLAAMADALRVPISYFFGDVRPDDRTQTPPSLHRSNDLLERPETIELIRTYCAIRDETVRHQALAIVRAIAEAMAPQSEVRKRSGGGRRARA
jgi:transcriptional regulator with XRE-family HTH domain